MDLFIASVMSGKSSMFHPDFACGDNVSMEWLLLSGGDWNAVTYPGLHISVVVLSVLLLLL